VTNVESWTEEFLHLSGVHGGIDYDVIGASNDELPIMNEILNTVVPGRPVLVLFFTDGGFRKKGPISELMRAASSAPVFWQFVGIGRANYGVLERLDDMEGRVVDNAGFFAIDDIDQVSDDDLYQRLLRNSLIGCGLPRPQPSCPRGCEPQSGLVTHSAEECVTRPHLVMGSAARRRTDRPHTCGNSADGHDESRDHTG
jgi:hypothetical protein